MTMPKGIGAIDLMLNVPGEDNSGWYEFMKPLLLDEESRKVFEMPAQYLFKDIPKTGKQTDYGSSAPCWAQMKTTTWRVRR